MASVKLLGEGSYGSVTLYNHTTSDGTIQNVAAKTSDYLGAPYLQTEIDILSKLKGSPRIVQLYRDELVEELDDKGNKGYAMLMEYAPGGSLLTLMEGYTDKRLPDPMIREFTCMILEGLVSIHDHGNVHCDLKPENILVFPSSESKSGHELKITDFGVSKRDGDDKWWRSFYQYVGTSVYMSPESVGYGETTKALDIWSLGCIVLEMYTGKRPWWHTKFDLTDLKKCYKPLIPNDLPPEAEDFINICLLVYTEGRRTALKLLEHDFVRAYVNKKETKDKKEQSV